VGSTSLVSQISCHSKPCLTVTGASSRDSVGHFVQENLVDVVIISQPCKVARNGDAAFLVIAGTKPSLCVVEGETP